MPNTLINLETNIVLNTKLIISYFHENSIFFEISNRTGPKPNPEFLKQGVILRVS